jgi:hypothetical protein
MLISALLVVLGVVVIARTVQAGVGGGLGLIIGAMLVAAGALRLWLVLSLSAADRAKPGRRPKGGG